MERTRSIQRVLVGCGGDAGLQIVRSVQAGEMEAVAVYADGESRAPQLDEAAYAVHLSGRRPYEDVQAVLSAALDAGADAMHPGTAPYARSPELAQFVQQCGMAWVGPRVDQLLAYADVAGARARLREAGLEVLPSQGPNHTPEETEAAIIRLGAPLTVRSIHRGGPSRRFDDAAAARAWLSDAPFPNLVERAPAGARTVVVLIMGDGAGNAIHIGAHAITAADGAGGHLRECPPPGLGPDWVERVGAAAADACGAGMWLGVASVVMRVDTDGRAWCTDLDPRVPDGFPLHDLVYGVDLIAAQLTLASGDELGWSQEGVTARGAALEARIVATGPGQLTSLRGLPRAVATALHARQDRLEAGQVIAVLRVRGPTRHAALVKLRGCLGRITVAGVPTNLDALRAVFDQREFWDGAVPDRAEW